MQNFENDEGAPHSPQPPADSEISLAQREFIECFEEIGMRYGIDQRDLPFDVLAALTRHMNGNLHPHSVGDVCTRMGSILTDMGADMTNIAADARKRCH